MLCAYDLGSSQGIPVIPISDRKTLHPVKGGHMGPSLPELKAKPNKACDRNSVGVRWRASELTEFSNIKVHLIRDS